MTAEAGTATPGVRTIPPESIPGIPALARGLATGDPDVTAFLPDRPVLDMIAARAREVLARFTPRVARGAELPDLAAGARAGVFTGQQTGLFTGPLLTVVKALAAEKLSDALEGLGVPCSPVFWCASEDHDLVEVTRLVVPDAGGMKELGPDPATLSANRSPVGALPIGIDVVRFLEAAAAGLGTPPDGESVEALREKNEGRTFLEGFGATLRWLLGDLAFRLVDAAREGDKPDLVPLATRLLRERHDVRRILDERAAALEASGFPLQVTTEAAALPLFARVGDGRYLLRQSGTALELKGFPEERTFEIEEAIARFESGEWLPSFAALTRPLAASTLYPVAATILGPSEIAYWAQLHPLFAWAGIVPPVVVPRPMVALIEPASKRLLEKLGLTVDELLGGVERLLAERGEGRAAALLARLDGVHAAAADGLGGLREELVALDPGLEKPLATTGSNVGFAFEKLRERVTAAAGRADETFTRQVARLAHALAPGGTLAERVYTPVPYLLRFGRATLIDALRRDLRWDAFGLNLVEL